MVMTKKTVKTLLNMDNKQLGHLLILVSLADTNGMISLPKGKKPMLKSTAGVCLGMAYKTALKFMDAMLDQGIISERIVWMYRKEHRAYFINEQFKLSALSEGLGRSIFKSKVYVSLYKSKELTSSELGLLYKTTRFINSEDGYLENKEGTLLKAKEAAELCGMDVTAFLKAINKMSIKMKLGKELYKAPVYCLTGKGDNSLIMINPLVATKRKRELKPDDRQLDIFKLVAEEITEK